MKQTVIFFAVLLTVWLGGCAQRDHSAQGFNNVVHTPQGCYVSAPDDTPDEHGFGKRCPS